MRLAGPWRLRLLATLLGAGALLAGLAGCGDDEEPRRGTQIEWRVGTPGPDALATGAPAAPPANPTAPPAG